jgi:hypothetical protein
VSPREETKDWAADARSLAERLGWTLRPGAKASVLVAQRGKSSLYATSPKAMFLLLQTREKFSEPEELAA